MLALALLGQAVSDRVRPDDDSAAGRSVGRAGFAYLSGLRAFGAAVLWNRLEPQFHEYYAGSLDNSEFMIPTLRLVTWLDPQFVEAYYLGPWILWRTDLKRESWEFALEGAEKNPRSGVLLAQLAQLALIEDDVDRAKGYALSALEADIEWRSLSEQHDSYAIIRSVFLAAEEDELYRWTEMELGRIDAELEAQIGEEGLEALHEGHDHDHDH